MGAALAALLSLGIRGLEPPPPLPPVPTPRGGPTEVAGEAPVQQGLKPLRPARHPVSRAYPGSLRPRPWGGDSRHFLRGPRLDTQTFRGTIHSTVALLEVHRSYVHEGRKREPGSEVREVLRTPPLTVLHDFWITERGEKIPAALRNRSQARADYQATVRRTRDPGLLEWEDQGEFSFSLYPVLVDGTPKQASWRQESVLEVGAGGWVRLLLPLGGTRTRSLEIDLELHEPRKIRDLRLPEGILRTRLGPGRWRLRGSFSWLKNPPSTLLLEWRVHEPDWTPGAPVLAQRVGPEGFLAQVAGPVYGSEVLPLTFLGRAPGGRFPSRLGELRERFGGPPVPLPLALARRDPLEIPGESWERLRAMARVQAVLHEESERDPRERVRELTELTARHRFVTPVGSLYAKPGLREDSVPGGSPVSLEAQAAREVEAREAAALRGQRLRSSGPARPRGPAYRVELGSFLMVPNFQASRRRANDRACFANQKTMAGAIEMYNLDFDTDLPRDRVATFGVGALLEPEPGLEVDLVHWQRFVHRGPGTRHGWLEMDEILPELVENGYLQQAPRCPGSGRDGGQYVLLTESGNGLFCRRHGAIQPPRPGVSPLQQLQDWGWQDPALLAGVSTSPLGSRGRALRLTHLGELGVFLLLMAWWRLGTREEAWAAALLSGSVGFLGALLVFTFGLLDPTRATVFRIAFTATWVLLWLASFTASPDPSPPED